MTLRYKYPRTMHLPWSPGWTKDDRVLKTTEHFVGQEVVVTEKMDGENTTLARDYTHARSVSSSNHISRHWLKQFHSTFAYGLPADLRVCGENLYAQHSIAYDNLLSYFLAFSVWERDFCWHWDDTVEYVEKLGLSMVPVLWRGIWDEKKIVQLVDQLDLTRQEGIVVRRVDAFSMQEFSLYLAKWVRTDHVTTDEHWLNKPVIPNKLREL